MEALREAYALGRLELRRNLRSVRVIALLALYAIFSLLILLVIGSIASTVKAAANARVSEMGGDSQSVAEAFAGTRTGILGWLFSGDTAIAETFQHVPLMVFVVFKVTLVFLPAYIALMGFDQISGEVGSRSVRYVTVRAKRSSILVGKFWAQGILLLGLTLVIDLGIFIYAKATNTDFAVRELFTSLPRFWLAAAIFSASYLALTSLCSSLFRTPAVCLVFNFIALFVLWLSDVVGRSSSWGLLSRASPSHYANGLLNPTLAVFGPSAAGCVAIAAAFFGLAYLIFRTRDL